MRGLGQDPGREGGCRLGFVAVGDTNTHGRTALQFAAGSGLADVVHALLGFRANPAREDDNHKNALDKCMKNNTACYNALMAAAPWLKMKPNT